MAVCSSQIVEEEECWRQYEVSQALKSVQESQTDAQQWRNAPSQLQSRLAPESRNEAGDDAKYVSHRAKCSAHMDEIDEVQPRVYKDRYGEQCETSNFWLRQLDAAESSDPNRLSLCDWESCETLFGN
jgi:hypothetical protein